MSDRNRTTEAFEEAYKALNEKQRRAVDTIEGPVLVIAGPGSGKTQILSVRVGNILAHTDALPSNILCLTFTESAAANMRERLAELIGRDAYRVAIHTFHNFGVDIIERHPEYFYNNATFAPADELVQIEVITELLDRAEHDNPLRTRHPEQGFTYLHPIRTMISQLKKAGLRPSEFRSLLAADREALETINPWMESLFAQRLTKQKVNEIESAIRELRQAGQARPMPVATFRSLEEVVADSLEAAMEAAAADDSTKPVSAWKQRWAVKDEDGHRVFKDTLAMDRLTALADIYEQYMDEMYRRGYYDFDDMLLSTIRAVEENTVLRNQLQEQYRYILVDEFQDTNEAQMRLLSSIADAPVNEGRPNIMAVGDDDQAIYKFQGAEVSNILQFRHTYTDPAVVTLTDNYRSSQDILDVARFVIGKGEERLEERMPDIEKELTAAHTQMEAGDISYTTFPTRAHEYSWVASQIRRTIDKGSEAGDIAVIARQHKHLLELLPYLYQEGVPVRYERQQNVLEEPHVHQIIQMARFVVSLSSKRFDEADELLPEILSYPFFEIERATVWRISVRAARDRVLWLDVMQAPDDVARDADEAAWLRSVAAFFLEVAKRSNAEPLEFILDYLIGSHIPLTRGSEDETAAENGERPETGSLPITSPFRSYYFSRDAFERNAERYITFLSSLQVFVDALREYKQGQPLGAQDLVAFVDLHTENGLPVVDSSPYVSADDAVQLLTAHKAKGLEFDTVFVVNAIDEVWAGKERGSILPLPMNVPIMPAGDTLDDQLRLFFVAVTRAKRYLYMTAYHAGDNGKQAQPLRFLAPETDERDALPPSVRKVVDAHGAVADEGQIPETANVLFSSFATAHQGPFAHDEEALLRSLVEQYQMSVTHLNNFLNVARGGPQLFLEQNLLRFPQAKSPSGAFGSAMHRALELTLRHVRAHETLPDPEQVVAWFETALTRERLPERDHTRFLERGAQALRVYLSQQGDTFDAAQLPELNFRQQGVVIGNAELAGKIDRFVPIGDTHAQVHDYKTGRAKTGWNGTSPHEKIQLHQFKQQLIVYKLLVENAKDYSGYTVDTGVLEFVEPKGSGDRARICELRYEISDEDVTHVSRLIEAVYERIVNLDFPDVSGYSQDLTGIEQFESDLVQGNI